MSYISIIGMYAQDIERIYSLIYKYISAESEKYIFIAPSELEKIKLGDVYLKYRASELSEYLSNRFDDDKYKSTWGNVDVQSSFNNKKPTVSLFYKQYMLNKEHKKEEVGILGIQIEDKQFRLHCGFNSEKFLSFKTQEHKKYNNAEALYEVMKGRFYLENTNKEDKEIRGFETTMRNKFCRYTNKSTGGIHIYQYWNISNKMNFSDIFKIVEKEIIKAKKIINDGFDYSCLE